MTLQQAQKKFDDAIEMSVTFKVNTVSEAELRKWAIASNTQSKVLFCEIDSTTGCCITSRKAFIEDQRQMSMIIGTKVVMTGDEGRFYPGKEWVVAHGPQTMCGELVVWLDGYSGAYACKFLKIID